MFKYERLQKPLLPVKKFYKRLFNNALFALFIIFSSLGIGVVGYMRLGHLKFVDALLNASMILGGMGPVDVLTTDAAKYFASAYALFSGVTILSIVGVVFAPVIHRIMHRYHLETDNEEDENERKSKSRNE